MKTALINRVKAKIALTGRETEILNSRFREVEKRKGELLLREGALARHLYFIISGFVRSFHISNGEEITTQIAVAGDFVTSFESYNESTPSEENIQCISGCELLSISKADHGKLYDEVAHWMTFCNSVYEDSIIRYAKRVNSLQNLSASERYEEILATQPEIALNASVKHLASYLGIKPQSLSRIRKSI